MSKNFNDFLNQCNSKDWSAVAVHISLKFKSTNYSEEMFNANTEATLTILREYHDWLNS